MLNGLGLSQLPRNWIFVKWLLEQTPYSENLWRSGESVSARNFVLNSRRKFSITPRNEQQIAKCYEVRLFVAIRMKP
jgi:hypothetical protein